MSTTAAVTGAASGLGREICEHLLAQGRRVVLIDRNSDVLSGTTAQLEAQHHGRVAALVADLSTTDGILVAAAGLSEQADLVALVNNAGGQVPGPQYPEAPRDAWLSAMTVNLLAPMMLTQLLWAQLADRNGAVVNIGSSAGIGGDAYESPEYGAAKAGVHRFTSSLSSRHEVRVMAVVPGWIGLERAQREWAALSAQKQREVGPLIPPARIAAAVVALLDGGRAGEVVEILH